MRNRSSRKQYFLPRAKLEALLRDIGVVVSGDTSTDIIAYCPFHHNRSSPAFNISLAPPHLWKCHNGKCAKQGNIITLLTMKGYSFSEAEKMVLTGALEIDDLVSVVEQLMSTEKEDIVDGWRGIDPSVFRDSDKANGWPARNYMLSRGITAEAIEFFGIGYSKKKDMAVIPVLDERGQLCGTIGREIKTKRYQYSTGLTRGQLIWNIHNARQYDSIILTEGALDSVYIWQAGFPNVGAVLGSAISPRQWDQIRRNFTEIICFFDNDDAGNSLRDSIVESVKDLGVYFVEYPTDRGIEVDPGPQGETIHRPLKDPGELTGDEIRYMIENATSSIEYLLDKQFEQQFSV